jgi:type IV pilus assembly protein PilO
MGEQLDKIPSTQKILLLLLLGLGGVVVFYLFVYSSVEDEISGAKSRISQLTERRAELNAQKGDIERLQTDIDELCERQSSFLEKLPPKAEVGSLLQSIHQQAQLVGLQIDRFERKEDQTQPNYKTIPVSMKIQGTYDQVADFFYFIGRQQRIVNVKDITLSRSGTDLIYGPPRLSVTCEVMTYYTDLSTQAGGKACAKK